MFRMIKTVAGSWLLSFARAIYRITTCDCTMSWWFVKKSHLPSISLSLCHFGSSRCRPFHSDRAPLQIEELLSQWEKDKSWKDLFNLTWSDHKTNCGLQFFSSFLNDCLIAAIWTREVRPMMFFSDVVSDAPKIKRGGGGEERIQTEEIQ